MAASRSTPSSRSSRSSATSSSGRKASSTTRQNGRSSSGGRNAAKPAPRSRNGRPVDRNTSEPTGINVVFEGHGTDLRAIGLVLLSVLLAFSVYGGVGGALGRGLNSVVRLFVGVLVYGVPVALGVLGVLMLWRRPAVEPNVLLKRRVAVCLWLASLVAAIHVLLVPLHRGGSTFDRLRKASGITGWLFGQPLLNLVGQWGGLVVLVVVVILGLSLFTGRSLAELFTGTKSGLAPVGRNVGRAVASLFKLGTTSPEVEEVDSNAPTGVMSADSLRLFDQDADRSTRKRASADPDATGTLPTPLVPPVRPRVVVPVIDAVDTEQLELKWSKAMGPTSWTRPSLSMLSRSDRQDVDTAEVEARGQRLEAALAEHGVETRLVGMVVGPTVTRYELELGVGVKVSRVTALNKDIAYALASPDVRIIAPIPGRQAIGVEVPNAQRHVVALGDILTSEEAAKATHPLEVAIGRDITGRASLVNLATMPHVLIAGQTGAGKSSCLNSILTSIMMRATPDQVGLILIDPKRVEMTQYDRIPHLLTGVVTNPKKAANALDWAVREMERRYDLLSEVGVRDIGGYNAAFDAGKLSTPLGDDREFERLRFILVVVDELADLMMVAARDVENSICRIAQMARAVGIHLVIATQRPSVNVITGVIKANVPARMAFAVASATDSKVILDQTGAERLVGRGDMLLLGPTASTPQRVQGAWVEEAEVHAIADFWRNQTPEPEAFYTEGVADEPAGDSGDSVLFGGSSGDPDDDELLRQAWELVVRSQLGSTSMLQRKLRVGFARAGRLMDLLEERGVVGPSEGSKARTVNMTPEELEDLIESGVF